MFTKSFWKQAFERAAKTFIQVLVVGAGLGEPGADLFHLDWRAALGAALAAAVASVVTSVVTSRIGQKNSPSAVTVQ